MVQSRVRFPFFILNVSVIDESCTVDNCETRVYLDSDTRMGLNDKRVVHIPLFTMQQLVVCSASDHHN